MFSVVSLTLRRGKCMTQTRMIMIATIWMTIWKTFSLIFSGTWTCHFSSFKLPERGCRIQQYMIIWCLTFKAVKIQGNRYGKKNPFMKTFSPIWSNYVVYFYEFDHSKQIKKVWKLNSEPSRPFFQFWHLPFQKIWRKILCLLRVA